MVLDYKKLDVDPVDLRRDINEVKTELAEAVNSFEQTTPVVVYEGTQADVTTSGDISYNSKLQLAVVVEEDYLLGGLFSFVLKNANATTEQNFAATTTPTPLYTIEDAAGVYDLLFVQPDQIGGVDYKCLAKVTLVKDDFSEVLDLGYVYMKVNDTTNTSLDIVLHVETAVKIPANSSYKARYQVQAGSDFPTLTTVTP